MVYIVRNSRGSINDEAGERIFFKKFSHVRKTYCIVHTHGEAQKAFYALREVEEFRKKPSTSELIDWLQALIVGGVSHNKIASEIPFAGTLLKKEADYDFFFSNYVRGGSNTLYIRRQ